MPWLRTHPKQKSDKPIEARTLRMLAETCDWISRIKVTAPLELTTFGGGPLIRYAGTPSSGIYEAIVTTAITAASGTTYGLGYAQVYIGDSTDTDPAVSDPAFPMPVEVRNWLQGSGTIAVDKHVLIASRASYYLLVTGDC